jgi:hypothetical protein
MLKKEHIRQAIEAVSKRDPEVGYTLDEMLSMGRITPLTSHSDVLSGEDFHFLIDEKPVTVRRITFFNAGTAPIEERLLIKYGEMLRKQQYETQSAGINFHEAARDIRVSGIRFMVMHEIDYAVAQMKSGIRKADPDSGLSMTGSRISGTDSEESDKWQQIVHRLESIKKDRQDLSTYLSAEKDGVGPALCYQGALNMDAPASFVRFPYCMDALMQVAELNLEFFHVRFLLSCLAGDRGDTLFACIVNNRIEGMVYLTFKKSYLSRAVEIRYIATVRGRPVIEKDSTPRVLKGVGTLLIAGVWMVWKTLYREAKEFLLDSEVGARSFYEALGFQSRGFSEFTLRHPKGRLVTAILDMAARCPDLPGDLVDDLTLIVKEQFRILRKKGRRKHININRQLALDSIKACFQAGAHTALAETAMRELGRHQSAIPESADLFRLVDEGK